MNPLSILRGPGVVALFTFFAFGCDPTPAALPDAALDGAPLADAGDAGGDDAGDGGGGDVVTLPTCQWPDGGPPANIISMGRSQTLALCNFCHQDTVLNAGVFAGQLAPRPRTTAYGANLTPDRTTGIGRRSDQEVLRAIRLGIGADGRRLCEMRPFAPDAISDEAMCAMLAYLRSLDANLRAIPASTCAR